MKRRTFLKSSGLAGVAFTASAPAVIAQSGVRWRLAHSFPRSLDTVFGGAEIFAALVRDMTGGRFEISVHGPGELVPPFGVLDAAQNGTVECTHTASNFFAGKDETFALNGIPFGMNSRQLLAWQFEGNGPIADIAVGMQMEGLPTDYITTRNDKVNAVTLEDVNRVARDLLDPDSLTFVVVGQPLGLDSTLN
ncbi:MAG: extracellular solute-binding protein, family 7 [Rhodobacteraceae bacterium HLUCCA24]|nr:MAG: extracellular solute-binding protein, family 7 [Rhodobacteraceae bacterium HLUCCA24]